MTAPAASPAHAPRASRATMEDIVALARAFAAARGANEVEQVAVNSRRGVGLMCS